MTNRLYFRYICSDFKANRRENISEGAAFMLFAAILSIAVTVFFSFTKAYGEYSDKTYGLYDGYAIGVSDNELEKAASDSKIDRYSYIYTGGYIDSLNEKSDPVTMGYADGEALKMLNIAPIQGRLPERDDEIALEQTVYSRLQDRIDENGKITLSVHYFTGFDAEKSFAVVGIIPDYVYKHSKLLSAYGEKADPMEQLPSILCGRAETPSLRLMLINAADGENPEAVIKSVSTKCKLNHGRINGGADDYKTGLTVISILAFAVGTVFLFGSMKLRRADFAKRTRRLKICGINCGDIFKYKVLSLLPLSAVSSLIGTAVGSLISLALINILTGIIDYMSVHIPVTALIFITLFDIIFVIAIALLYEHRELSKRPLYTKAETKEKTTIRLSRRIFIRKPLLSWSLKLFAYDSARQASIFLCIFVTNFFAVYMASYLYYETKWQEKQTFDYEIQNSSDYVSAGSFGIRMGSSATPEPADTDYIFASDEVKSVYGIAASRIHILDGSLSEENPFKRLAPDTYTTVEMLREEMESYGYPTDAPLFVSRIVFCNKELISTALTNSKTGDFELKKGEAVLCVEGESPYKVGDTVKVTQPS